MLNVKVVWKDPNLKITTFPSIEYICFPTLMDYPDVYRLMGKEDKLKYIITKNEVRYISIIENPSD